MVFSSHIFLFYFLPIALALYFVAKGRARLWVLTFVSYLFYGWSGPWFIAVILWSTCVDFICGNFISGHWSLDGKPQRDAHGETHATPFQRRLFLGLSLASNLGLLGFFKYGMFIQQNLNAVRQMSGHPLFQMIAITLPIGISFYTFESISYVVDIYLGRAKPASRATCTPLPENWTLADLLHRIGQEFRALGTFACYITQFPHLVAGPIIRFQELEPQLHDRTHTVEKFAQGVFFFTFGFAKKVLVADSVAEIADAAFGAQALHPGAAWIGVIAYAFQIYFDFSGYSDMAIGLGLMLGFEFPKNFDSPYKATSITDFWRRWHITLSTWLRDYLYIPLGGNRKGHARTYMNLITVMLLGGLWHGAAWKYVLWGGIHGVWLAVERVTKFDKLAWIPQWARIAITFTVVNIAWVFFRAADMHAATSYLACMFGLKGKIPATELLVRAQMYSPDHVAMLLLAAGIAFFGVQTWDLSKKITPWRATAAMLLLALSIRMLTLRASTPFLYFQF